MEELMKQIEVKQIEEKTAIVTGATRVTISTGEGKDDKFKLILGKTKQRIFEITCFVCCMSFLAPILVEKLKYLWAIISSLWN